MSGWLIDTNVLSELRRPKPAPMVARFVASRPLEQLFVSEVTLAEIRFGIGRVTDMSRRAEIDDWLTHKLRPMFERRVLSITEDVILKWLLLIQEGRQRRHTFAQPDLFIAAQALLHDLVVVTRDTSAFAATRVAVLNPWSANGDA